MYRPAGTRDLASNTLILKPIGGDHLRDRLFLNTARIEHQQLILIQLGGDFVEDVSGLCIHGIGDDRSNVFFGDNLLRILRYKSFEAMDGLEGEDVGGNVNLAIVKCLDGQGASESSMV